MNLMHTQIEDAKRAVAADQRRGLFVLEAERRNSTYHLKRQRELATDRWNTILAWLMVPAWFIGTLLVVNLVNQVKAGW